jgi:outer membrane lipoprotein-sorting protein
MKRPVVAAPETGVLPAVLAAAGSLVLAIVLCEGAAGGAATPSPAAGAPAHPALDQIVDRVEKTYAGAGDLTAHFRQTSTITAAGQVQRASGTVEVKRPGKMRWEYAEPEARLYVTDGKTFWVYTPEDKQVMVSEVGGALGATPLAFLMGAGTLRKEFEVREVRLFDAVGNTVVLALSDQKLNGGLPDARFTFQPPPGVKVITGPSGPKR